MNAGWATRAVVALTTGHPATIYPRGNSMFPLVHSGDKVILAPLAYLTDGRRESPVENDIVLARVHGVIYLHKVLAVNGNRVLIGNNKGGTNGWISSAAVYGKAVSIERS